MLQVGDRFPVERLSVQPEGPAVVFFYPAALTPGCTMEAKAFNDRYERFRAAGYQVIGVSIDHADRNDEFRAECGLDFPLVSDDGADLTTAIDALKDYGDYGLLARRVTFLLDADGVVTKVWDVDDAGTHPEDVLQAVQGVSIETVRSSYEAFAQGDLDGALAMMDEDIVWHQAQGLPHGGTYHGLATVRANVFDPLDESWWENFGADPEEIIGLGDDVVVLGRYTALAKGTGKPLDVPFCHVWRFRDGKAVRFHQFVDTYGWREALGA